MTAEGQEGSSLGNIRGKGGPGRGNSQCQNPKAGAAGRVHGPRRRQNGGEAGGGRAVWSERGQRQRATAHHVGRAVRTQRWISLCGGKELRVLSRKVT